MSDPKLDLSRVSREALEAVAADALALGDCMSVTRRALLARIRAEATAEPAMCRVDVGGVPCGEQEPCPEHNQPPPRTRAQKAEQLLEWAEELREYNRDEFPGILPEEARRLWDRLLAEPTRPSPTTEHERAAEAEAEVYRVQAESALASALSRIQELEGYVRTEDFALANAQTRETEWMNRTHEEKQRRKAAESALASARTLLELCKSAAVEPLRRRIETWLSSTTTPAPIEPVAVTEARELLGRFCFNHPSSVVADDGYAWLSRHPAPETGGE